MAFKLRKYQSDAIDFISSHRGIGLICIPAGGGKTATVLYLRKKYPALKKVLIICPASIKEQWKQNILDVFPDETIAVIYGSYSKHKIQEVMESNIVIINYDILFPRGFDDYGWKDFLQRMKWDLGVLDESHFCGSKDSNRTKAVKEIFSNIYHRVLLSGTPLLSSVESLYSQFNILRPLEWDSYHNFMSRYCPIVPVRQKVRGGATKVIYKPSKPQNLDELQSRMAECCYVVSKEVVYSHLPAVTETIIPCVVNNSELNNTIEKLKRNSMSSFADQQEAEKLLHASRQLLGQSKISACVDFVNDLLTTDGSRKVVVFTHHRAVTEATTEAFKGKAVKFYGGMSPDEKQQVIKKFLNDDSCKVIVMNSSAVTGVDSIQKKSNTCVWLELTSSSYIEEQATGRIRRVNSGEWFDKFFSYFMKSDSPLDEAILSVLADRRAVTKAVLQGDSVENDKEKSDTLEIIKKIKGV